MTTKKWEGKPGCVSAYKLRRSPRNVEEKWLKYSVDKFNIFSYEKVLFEKR